MFKDEMPITGSLNIRVYRMIDGNKVLVDKFCDHNLIVLTGKELMTFLLTGEPGSHAITQVAVGENTTDPDESDTTPLLNQYIKPVESYTFLSENTVQFEIEFDTGDANGMAISEFGLVSTSGVLFARKTRIPAIPKDSDVIIEGDWTIFLFECKVVDFAVSPEILTFTDSTIFQT